MKPVLHFLFLTLAINLLSQNITIAPYLQDAEPNSIHILWETDTESDGFVEFGKTEFLGTTVQGITYPSGGGTMIHEVKLEGLDRFTKYYYRVNSGINVSELTHFKTPPFASDNESFRIVAMSDMQRDGSFPNKFNEVVEDGVIKYLEDEYGGDITDNLALVMIPGDLVVTGTSFGQWRNHFFNPSESLFKNIPVYPVLGNHEQNSIYYFNYFKLPENGSPGFEEHWWHKDYGNMRIIGLNSNGPYDSQDQLDWLDQTLDNTCAVDSIDFVFAQLHHPHKSELWTPGESNFTGEVIQRLEQFSTNCDKPSIHFFGHTHGYSRGQSRDHKHLWINVATAGGAIDNWGEFPNFDYEEFSVSQDEYGFVVVELTDGQDPQMHIKRISRGDQDAIANNVLTDSFTIKVKPTQIKMPEVISPINESLAPECVKLVASPFESDGSIPHGQSHWQVFLADDGFELPVFESWKNFENWYYDIDTQKNDDLTDEEVFGLEENKNYIWRVRYRDRELNWSEWSLPASFTTGSSILPENLLINPGAENDLEAWNIEEGVVESLEAEVCDGISPYSGNRYFSVGGLCEHSEVAIAYQDIDVSMFADSIDAGALIVNFGGHLSNFGGSDTPEMYLQFRNANNMIIIESDILTTQNSSWTLLSESLNIFPTTRTIRVILKGTRNAGTDNDSYFDELFLRLGDDETDCTGISSNHHMPNIVNTLNIKPNPMSDVSIIDIPSVLKNDELKLVLIDLQGNKLNVDYSISKEDLLLDRGQLIPGLYNIILRQRGKLVGVGKLVVAK